MAPRNWKKPLTLIYDNNYKYGNSLYSGAIDDIERRYLHSMSRTHLGSDRPDALLSTFASSALSSAALGSSNISSSMSSTNIHSLMSDHKLSSHTSSSLDSGFGLRRIRSVPDMSSYTPPESPLSKYRHRALVADPFNLEEQARARRRRRRRLTDDQSPLVLPTIPEFISSTSSLHRTRAASSSAAASTDMSFLVDKCRHLQSELETVSHRVSEAEAKVKGEVSSAKSKIEMGLSELGLELADSGRQNSELQKVIKRQAKQMSEMQSLYDELHRHLAEASEELVNSQRRCHGLQSELDSVRHSLDQVAFA